MPTSPITATLPKYAVDGSRGYHLITADGVHGWIEVVTTDEHAVIATLGRRAWQVVGTVDQPEQLTPEWINEHAATILTV